MPQTRARRQQGQVHDPVVARHLQAVLHTFQAALRRQLPSDMAAALPGPQPPSTLSLATYYTQHLPLDRIAHLVKHMAVIIQSNSRGEADQQLVRLVGGALLGGLDAAELQEVTDVLHMVVRPISGLLWLAQEEPAALARAVADAARFQYQQQIEQQQQQQQHKQEGGTAAPRDAHLAEVQVLPGMTAEQLVAAIQYHAAAASRANLAYPGATAAPAPAAAVGGGSCSRRGNKRRKVQDAGGACNGRSGSSAAAEGGDTSSDCSSDTQVSQGTLDEELMRTPIALIVRGMGGSQPAAGPPPAAKPSASVQQQHQQQQQNGVQQQASADSMRTFLDALLQEVLPFHLTPFHFNNSKAGQAACFLEYHLPGGIAWEVSLLAELAAWSALTQWAAQPLTQPVAAAAAAAVNGGGSGGGAGVATRRNSPASGPAAAAVAEVGNGGGAGVATRSKSPASGPGAAAAVAAAAAAGGSSGGGAGVTTRSKSPASGHGAAAAGGSSGGGAGVATRSKSPGATPAAATRGAVALTQQQVEASVSQARQLLAQGVLLGPGWRMWGVALRACYPGVLGDRLEQLTQQQQQQQQQQEAGAAQQISRATNSAASGLHTSHPDPQQAGAGDMTEQVLRSFGCVLYAPEMVVGDNSGLGAAAAAVGLYDSSVKQQVGLFHQGSGRVGRVEVQQQFSYTYAGPGPAAALAQVTQNGVYQPHWQDLPHRHKDKQQQQQQQQQQQVHCTGQESHPGVLPCVWGLVVEPSEAPHQQQQQQHQQQSAPGGGVSHEEEEGPLVWPCCLLQEASRWVGLTGPGPPDATTLLLMDDMVGAVLHRVSQLEQQHPVAAAAAAGTGSRRTKETRQVVPPAAVSKGSSAAGRQQQQQQQQQDVGSPQQPLVQLLHHVLSPAAQEPAAAASGLQQLLDRLQQQRRLLSVSVGVTQPVGILSSWGTTTQLHLEQCALGSMNQLLAGAGKLWFICPTPAAALRLEQLVVSKYGGLVPLLDKQLGLQDFTLTELVEAVGMQMVWQEVGDLVLTLPGPSYHITVSSGPSLAVSANCYFDGGAQQLLPHLLHWAPRLVGEGGAMLPQHQSVLASMGMPEEEDWEVGLLPLHLAAELSAALASAAAAAAADRGGTGTDRPPPVPAGEGWVWQLCRDRCAQWLRLNSLVKKAAN